jgi:hypothetical protein
MSVEDEQTDFVQHREVTYPHPGMICKVKLLVCVCSVEYSPNKCLDGAARSCLARWSLTYISGYRSIDMSVYHIWPDLLVSWSLTNTAYSHSLTSQ